MNAPAIEAIKAQMKATWMAGDFGRIATFTEPTAMAFIKRRGIKEGMHVLDAACGTGNLAIPAAKAGAYVTGIDIATNLVEAARERARRERLNIRFDEGDVEELPYGDASFDLVVSMFGAMFAPRPERTAAELLRVCRPGGQIAMANWTPRGVIGEQHDVMGRHLPLPPGAASPLEWGDEATVRARLGGGATALRATPVAAPLKFPFSVPETVEFFRTYFGPAQRPLPFSPRSSRRFCGATWRASTNATTAPRMERPTWKPNISKSWRRVRESCR
jgi:SAM-dependent methyltransferase